MMTEKDIDLLTRPDYIRWDAERREKYPDAVHKEWESFFGHDRVAGFDDMECWVL